MFKTTKKSSNSMVNANQQMFNSLLNETISDLNGWSKQKYEKDVKETRELFKAIKRSF